MLTFHTQNKHQGHGNKYEQQIPPQMHRTREKSEQQSLSNINIHYDDRVMGNVPSISGTQGNVSMPTFVIVQNNLRSFMGPITKCMLFTSFMEEKEREREREREREIKSVKKIWNSAGNQTQDLPITRQAL